MKQNKADLIGNVFGELTILEIIPFYRNTNQKDYKCKVFCNHCKGNGILLLRGVLNGKSKGCGCLKKINPFSGKRGYPPSGLSNPKCKNLTNQRFGKLIALVIDDKKSKRISWKCKCDCGNSKSVETRHLTGGRIQSCGCNHYLKGNKSNSWKGYEEISGRQWSRVISGAKERNLEFNISIQDAWDKFIEQNRKCALSGKPLIFGYCMIKKERIGNASLDRIDSSKGYIPGNIQWVDKQINCCKMDLTDGEFLEMCKSVCIYKNVLTK